MNVLEVIRKNFGDGNLVNLRVFISDSVGRVRRVGLVNRSGFSLQRRNTLENGRVVSFADDLQICGVTSKTRIVGTDTILHIVEELP